jgi:pyridoxal phosphate enzyme (YggS family)
VVRKDELAENLSRVETEIAEALANAGRFRSEIKLIVVTKNFPVSDVEILYQLGVRDFGENREQEARAKVHFLSNLPDIRWHYQGQLQRNKLSSIGSWADTVHSVDDKKYLKGLSGAAAKVGRTLSCLIQISLDHPDHSDHSDQHGRTGRGGVDLAGACELLSTFAAERAELGGLEITGVMGVAPVGEAAEGAFSELQKAFLQLREIEPKLKVISAGMSGDFAPAIAFGATHLRIGSSILGSRPPML